MASPLAAQAQSNRSPWYLGDSGHWAEIAHDSMLTRVGDSLKAPSHPFYILKDDSIPINHLGPPFVETELMIYALTFNPHAIEEPHSHPSSEPTPSIFAATNKRRQRKRRVKGCNETKRS